MAARPKLTQRQQEVYDLIAEKIRSRGYGPTVREIATVFSIKSPNGVMCHLQALEKKGLIKREPNMSRAISLVEDEAMAPGIPLAGVIAAGSPIETYEQTERIDFGDLFSSESHYALQVRGQSMIEDHIDEGDYVIVHKQETARNGQIVVALVDGEETTLKRFYKEQGRFRLEPANSEMESIYADQVDILGIVVGVIRTFDHVR
ncbi:LexA repressor [Planctomycetes bacterium Pan216]|uniref:LexA repressor n=1 Tax=Kolteria novifilia TaxID=2527975 RepID=A0A518B5S8_9BACT|nr:LexA repressor [Planctomycetes bacterium Pan216]